jgi:hypothetical protein
MQTKDEVFNVFGSTADINHVDGEKCGSYL